MPPFSRSQQTAPMMMVPPPSYPQPVSPSYPTNPRAGRGTHPGTRGSGPSQAQTPLSETPPGPAPAVMQYRQQLPNAPNPPPRPSYGHVYQGPTQGYAGSSSQVPQRTSSQVGGRGFEHASRRNGSGTGTYIPHTGTAPHQTYAYRHGQGNNH